MVAGSAIVGAGATIVVMSNKPWYKEMARYQNDDSEGVTDSSGKRVIGTGDPYKVSKNGN
jgi:hypothetical protein